MSGQVIAGLGVLLLFFSAYYANGYAGLSHLDPKLRNKAYLGFAGVIAGFLIAELGVFLI
jgi:hypothetical protein